MSRILVCGRVGEWSEWMKNKGRSSIVKGYALVPLGINLVGWIAIVVGLGPKCSV